ncbi:hypothetical protein [Streptomyces sp. NPDC001604]
MEGDDSSSCPHDGIASILLHQLYVQKYGWDWLARFAAQDVQFARDP